MTIVCILLPIHHTKLFHLAFLIENIWKNSYHTTFHSSDNGTTQTHIHLIMDNNYFATIILNISHYRRLFSYEMPFCAL